MSLELTRAQTVLTLMCLALAMLFAYEIVTPPPEYAVPQIALARHNSPAVHWAAAPAPPADTFAAADARPLFNQSRKPYIEPLKPDAPNAPPPPPDAMLIGVIMDAQIRMALMKTPATPLAQSFAVGATVEGWLVTDIEADHVDLRSGANALTLTFALHGPANGKAPGH